MGEKGVFFVPEESLHSREVAISALKGAVVGEKGVFFVSEGHFRSWETRHICFEGPRRGRKGRHIVLEESLCWRDWAVYA